MDPCQIPPINRTDCLAFSKKCPVNALSINLTEIMRQKGDHPIIEAGMILRENLTDPTPLKNFINRINEEGSGILVMDFVNSKQEARNIIKRYLTSPEYAKHADYFKIIAWTNKAVTNLNTVARELLFGKNVPRFVVGEHLVANKALFSRSAHPKYKDMQYTVKATTSEEFIVLETEIIMKQFAEKGPSLFERVDQTFKMWKLKVQYKNSHMILNVIHEDSLADYNTFLNSLKNDAKVKKTAPYWMLYYTAVKWNDDVLYNYAISAHKSQGSTYANVMLHQRDLEHNTKIVERNRIKYTAYTRATERLYILK